MNKLIINGIPLPSIFVGFDPANGEPEYVETTICSGSGRQKIPDRVTRLKQFKRFINEKFFKGEENNVRNI